VNFTPSQCIRFRDFGVEFIAGFLNGVQVAIQWDRKASMYALLIGRIPFFVNTSQCHGRAVRSVAQEEVQENVLGRTKDMRDNRCAFCVTAFRFCLAWILVFILLAFALHYNAGEAK
jgi:hypothetical protein